MLTEADWHSNSDPAQMLKFLRDRGAASDRKLRLFSVACCRRAWDLLPSQADRDAVEVAERYADGMATTQELFHAARAANGPGVRVASRRLIRPKVTAAGSAAALAGSAAYDRVCAAINGQWAASESVTTALDIPVELASDARDAYIWCVQREQSAQAALLRDIFSSPFCPLTFDPSWLTSTVVSIATGIYQEKAFLRLPILADALADTGCSNEELLDHLRGPGPHVRGCWALDLVLGKE